MQGALKWQWEHTLCEAFAGVDCLVACHYRARDACKLATAEGALT